MATHSSVLAWRIPRTEESGRLWSMGWQSRTWLKWLSTHAPSLPHRCEGVLCRSSIGAATLSYIQNAQHTECSPECSVPLHIECSSAGFFVSTRIEWLHPSCSAQGCRGSSEEREKKVIPKQKCNLKWKWWEELEIQTLKNNSPPVTPRYNVSSSLQWMGQGQCLSKYSKQLCLPLAEITSTHIFNMDAVH